MLSLQLIAGAYHLESDFEVRGSSVKMSEGKRPLQLSFGWKPKRQRVQPTALASELAANIEEEEEREKSALDEWMRR